RGRYARRRVDTVANSAAPAGRGPRPLGVRERLLAAGACACSDAELLGVVLDAGAPTAAGVALAARLIGTAGGLERLDRPDRAAAAALILVHNHPSGDPTPSAEDAAITQRLRQVGEIVGIRVLDHVVIGRGRYTSMAEEGRW